MTKLTASPSCLTATLETGILNKHSEINVAWSHHIPFQGSRTAVSVWSTVVLWNWSTFLHPGGHLPWQRCFCLPSISNLPLNQNIFPWKPFTRGCCCCFLTPSHMSLTFVNRILPQQQRTDAAGSWWLDLGLKCTVCTDQPGNSDIEMKTQPKKRKKEKKIRG